MPARLEPRGGPEHGVADRGRSRRATCVGLWLLFVLLIAPGVPAAAAEPREHRPDAQRQADVARRGAQVMPFDLAKTTHVFAKTAGGGTQRVVAKDPKDVEQVRLVRSHLRAVGPQFRRGDYGAPEQIHGASMAGLEALRRAPPGAISVRYADTPAGGMLTYASRDPELIAALHRWFDAQLSDHGADAMAGHTHHGGSSHSAHRP